jgi:hypothetical protein
MFSQFTLKTKIIWFIAIFMFISYVRSPSEPKQSKTPATTRPTSSAAMNTAKSTPDYENDLEERCKDWIFYRNKAYKLGREGDREGAAEASRIMNRYYDDLRKVFPESSISKKINEIEASGYKVGM